MRKLLLMLAVLFGSTAAIHAQDAGKAAPVQPIAFNHSLHVQTVKMSCNDCHEPRGNGATLAMPQPPKCMRCHATIATDKPDIQRLAEAAKNEDPIQWVRVYRVPSFVTFSHKTHTSAGGTCEECHGPVAERTAIAPEKDTSMGSCIACHQARQAPATCDTCHAIISKNGQSPFDVDGAILARLHLQMEEKATITESVRHGSPRITPQLAAIAGFLHAPML